MRPATTEEIASWDDLVGSNPDNGNPLQIKAFAETKSKHGWEPKYYILQGRPKIAVLILSRQIIGLGEFWYIPKGPGVRTIAQLRRVVDAIHKLPHKPFAVRLDPELPADQAQQILNLGIVKSPQDVQYNVSTVVVKVDQEEGALLNSFKQKTRYNVRLALKKGVDAGPVPTNDETISKMYELTKITTTRAGLYLRDKQYFEDFWRTHSQQGTGQMFQASWNGQVLASAFVTYIGSKALYKDGGSTRDHAEVQAPYALQFAIMKWLKQQNVIEYDLHGVPPKSQAGNPNHPLAGLARFKLGFNQEITEYAGTFDLVLSAWRYQIWTTIGQRVASGFEHRFNNRLFY